MANSPSPKLLKLYTSSIDPLKTHKTNFSKLFDRVVEKSQIVWQLKCQNISTLKRLKVKNWRLKNIDISINTWEDSRVNDYRFVKIIHSLILKQKQSMRARYNFGGNYFYMSLSRLSCFRYHFMNQRQNEWNGYTYMYI